MDNCNFGINQGILLTQSGFRGNIALIQCPYIPHRVEVHDAQQVQVLDGAQVYWREVRRFCVTKKNSNKQQIIILATVMGVKHCKYISSGINTISTLEMLDVEGVPRLVARPINKKLPYLQIIDYMGHPIGLEAALTQYPNFSQFFYWVQIYSWNFGEKYPNAFVTGIFSKSKTAESEAEAILYSLQIDQRQPSLTLQKNQITSDFLPISTHKKFNQMVFTIDPPDCQDMQDALSLQILGPSLYRVGVHISDVSSFMNLVDRKQICFRGTSFYLPHKTINLFPKIITQLCSFQPKKQRLSFSVFFNMNQNGDIFETSFQKLVIKNTAKMNYEEAQEMIEGRVFDIVQFANRHSLDMNQAQQLVEKVRILKNIAFCRRKIRKSQEVLDRNQVTFDLDKNNIPVRVGIKKRFDSQRLVEEFMIATNGQVARKLVKDYGPNALVIHHPKPSQYSINSLNSFFSDFGVMFKNDSIISLETEMKKLFQKQGVKDEFKQALMMRAIQIQQLAVYSRHMNSEKGHYGLNMEYYTHFTSPLRRYADIITHQQLSFCLISNGHKPKYNPILDEQIQFANKARAKNKKLRNSIVEGFLNLYLHKNKQVVKAKAMVMSLGLKSATIYLPFYNLIKEVNWSCQVTNAGKDSIHCQGIGKDGITTFTKQLSKNDSIDVEMESDVHQEVKLKMLLKNEQGQFIKI